MSDFTTSETVDLLQRAVMNGIIDINDVQRKLIMEKEKRILEEHPFKIWKGKDGEWFTYLKDLTKKTKRRLLHRKTKEDIEKAIIKANMVEDKKQNIKSLSELYPYWLKSKSYHTNSTNYIKRIDSEWKKHYRDDPISKMPFRELTKVFLDDWCHKKIKEYEMTKTSFYNMSMILRQALEFAEDNCYIASNPMRKIKINTKLFVRSRKKEDKTQVFMVDEQPLLEKACWEKFKKNPKITTPLAILLAFKLGVRFGELAALRESDIQDNYIYISRQEVIDYTLNISDDKVGFSYNGAKTVEYTKSFAGLREIYLTVEAREIIDLILESNRTYGNKKEDFLFVFGNRKMLANTMEKRLYDYCDAAGISKKSSHKIRKTFISELIDNNININTIRKIVGHEHETTTYGSYCFDRKRNKEVEMMLESALKSCDNMR